MSNEFLFQRRMKPGQPVALRDGSRLNAAVLIRGSLFYPGHRSLINEQRVLRTLPESGRSLAEEVIDPAACRFCHPGTLCAEDSKEQTEILVESTSFILARNPYYYLPGHCILFPFKGPHRLEEAREEDWRLLLSAGAEAATLKNGFRLGFNAGSYLCSGGSQRHLHLQLVPIQGLAPYEKRLKVDLPKGVSFERMREAYREKSLILEEGSGGSSFLTACWAPKYNLELLAVFPEASRFHSLDSEKVTQLARWIHTAAIRFAIPEGGGLNGYGLEVPGFPFMVRIIPRLPGAVHAFMETGAGYMIISYMPEKIHQIWRS